MNWKIAGYRGVWNDRRAVIRLADNPINQSAIPFSVISQIGDFPPTELLSAWAKRPNTPSSLGQTNFFLKFDVCFYRSKMEFEVDLKYP